MIKIENESLANYLMFKLKKEDNKFTEEEIKTIDEIVLNPYDINNTYFEINLDIIKAFLGLKKLTLKNLYISQIDINNLSKLEYLENICFEKCEFENADFISQLHLKELELINCDINNYNFIYLMNSLVALTVISGNISLEQLNILTEIRYLQISYSHINQLQDINLPLLEELHIDNSTINDLSILKNLKKLKRLGISEEQFLNNKELIKEMIENGVLVLNQNMVEFNEGGNLNE